MAGLDPLVLVLVFVVILADIGLVQLYIRGQLAIQNPRQKVLGLKGELRLIRRILVEFALARFLSQGLETHQLLGDLALAGTLGRGPILLGQSLHELLELAGGHFFIADREHNFIERLSWRGGWFDLRRRFARSRGWRFVGWLGSRGWSLCGQRSTK